MPTRGNEIKKLNVKLDALTTDPVAALRKEGINIDAHKHAEIKTQLQHQLAQAGRVSHPGDMVAVKIIVEI